MKVLVVEEERLVRELIVEELLDAGFLLGGSTFGLARRDLLGGFVQDDAALSTATNALSENYACDEAWP
jgi:hypothetical protein